MFLDKMFNFQQFFGKSVIPAYSRPVEYFFQDMQRTLDEANMETMNIAILNFRKILYTPDPQNKVGEDELLWHMEEANEKKNEKPTSSELEEMTEYVKNDHAKQFEKERKQADAIQLVRLNKFRIDCAAETDDQRFLEEAVKQLFQEERKESFRREKEDAVEEYHYRIQKAKDQFNKYRTLLSAEKQQKAFERQLEINRRIPPSILPDLEEEDFKEFCEEPFRGGFSNCETIFCIVS